MRLRQLCALVTVTSMPPPSIKTKQKSEMAGRNQECRARKSLSVSCRIPCCLVHLTDILLSCPFRSPASYGIPTIIPKMWKRPSTRPSRIFRPTISICTWYVGIYTHPNILLTKSDPLARGIHPPELFPTSPRPGHETLQAGRCSHL